MGENEKEFESACHNCLTRYFERYPEPLIEKRRQKWFTCSQHATNAALAKRRGGLWGVVYLLANRERRAVGFPGALNADVEKAFDVSMGTIRRRAKQVNRLLTV